MPSDNDVLIVNAAGNEGIDLDKKQVYPNDQKVERKVQKLVTHLLPLERLIINMADELVANFSNYGKTNVDLPLLQE